MARLTKAQEKQHDEALALVSLNRMLKDDEIEFVFRHYSPMATHRVAKGAIFFTPYEIASDFAVMARWQGSGRVIDYAAGIGGLTHHMLLAEYWDESPAKLATKHHVCVEIEREFVELGKKLLPQVEWVCGRWHDNPALHELRAALYRRAIVFDRALMESLGTFDMGIARTNFVRFRRLARFFHLLPGERGSKQKRRHTWLRWNSWCGCASKAVLSSCRELTKNIIPKLTCHPRPSGDSWRHSLDCTSGCAWTWTRSNTPSGKARSLTW